MRLIDADALKKEAKTSRETTDAFIELIDDAPTIEALKEQQPRVLTLLEVINHFSIPYDISKDIDKAYDYQEEIEPLYFDFPMDDIDPYIVHWRGYQQVGKYIDEWKIDYGKRWRVWSAKPTKEQRKAVPWETH